MSSSRFELGSGVTCDLDALIASKLLVQANSGGGKSRTVRRILEQTAGKVQQLVIDPEGEFSTLREKHDYILAAPTGGDTVASVRTAKLLALRLLELNVSAILDIFELPPKERVLFVRLFLTALIDAPKKLWHPVLVVVDEAHVFCPQKGEAESAGAVIDLASRGRKRGYCAVFATQRLSKLHKDAAAECNNKLIGRASLDVDMNRAAEELGFVTREDKLSLRQLSPGEFFAFGPAITRDVTKILMGPVFTTHPEAGARIALAPPPPTKAVLALLPQLSDLPAEAAAREKSIEDLQHELAKTKRDLSAALRGAPVAPPKEVVKTVERRVEIPVLKDGQLRRAEQLLGTLEKSGLALREVCGGLAAAIASTTTQAVMTVTNVVSRPTLRPATPSPTNGKQDVTPSVPQVRAGDGVVNAPQQRILDELAGLESLGMLRPPRRQVAFLAGVSPKSSGFEKNLGTLRTLGCIVFAPESRLALTDTGRVLAAPISRPQNSEALQSAAMDRVSGPQAALLRILLREYPKAMHRTALADAVDVSYKSSGFEKNLGTLRSFGLVAFAANSMVVATDALFLDHDRAP